jgi:hypothetical protein
MGKWKVPPKAGVTAMAIGGVGEGEETLSQFRFFFFLVFVTRRRLRSAQGA